MKSIRGNIIDIHKRRIFKGEVQFADGRITAVVPKRVEEDVYIAPGFVDAHVHIESSMLTPAGFSELVVPRGTVAVVTDPHEIANVLGVSGIEFMIEDSTKVPLKTFFGAPSCVPATPFETSGATVGPSDIEALMQRKDIWFLSEMMNYPGVVNDSEEVVAKLKSAIRQGKPIDGHAPGLKGAALDKYVSSGISTDHECAHLQEALDKLSLGMKIQIREGSAARNFEALQSLYPKYADHLMLCTDDSHPDEILNHGHIDRLLRKGVNDFGLDVFDLLRSASLVPVTHYNLPVGLLRVGDAADFVVLNNLKDFEVVASYIEGEKVYDNSKGLAFSVPGSELPNRFVARMPEPEDLIIRMPADDARVRVIEVEDGELLTGTYFWQPVLRKGAVIEASIQEDVLKMVVLNRYVAAQPSVGFVKNIGLKDGAIGGSIAHDSHNLIVVGTNDEDILALLKKLISSGGGIGWSARGESEILALPIAGLMSPRSGKEVAEAYVALSGQARELGSSLKAPFMTLSFLSLLVIPSLKLGDQGLFDVDQFSFVSLFE